MPTTEGPIYEINQWTPSKSIKPSWKSLNGVPLYCAQIAPNASGALIPGVVGETQSLGMVLNRSWQPARLDPR
jgi:hypothetical protein